MQRSLVFLYFLETGFLPSGCFDDIEQGPLPANAPASTSANTPGHHHRESRRPRGRLRNQLQFGYCFGDEYILAKNPLRRLGLARVFFCSFRS